MQFLGKSLEQRLEERDYKFSVKTVIQVAVKIINIIQYVHSCGIIHRDIKPDNFVFGDPETGLEKTLYVIDFGLAKYWKNGSKHIARKTNQMILGTARYMSINAHRRHTQSRRDDLEAIGYMLIYMLRGNLPWEGLKTKDREERNAMILERKVNNTIDSLVEGYPKVFGEFLRTARNLKFEENPDYEGYRQRFLDFARSKKIKLNNLFDWDPPGSQES
jgi:serine/threonine protein kinase